MLRKYISYSAAILLCVLFVWIFSQLSQQLGISFLTFKPVYSMSLFAFYAVVLSVLWAGRIGFLIYRGQQDPLMNRSIRSVRDLFVSCWVWGIMIYLMLYVCILKFFTEYSLASEVMTKNIKLIVEFVVMLSVGTVFYKIYLKKAAVLKTVNSVNKV